MNKKQIVLEIAKRFRCFGIGSQSIIPGNPIACALADEPTQFAAGVDVADVVSFVLIAAKKHRNRQNVK